MRYVSVAEAAESLQEGGVGLVPTETVVGLVAGESGLSRLFEIKGRQLDKPIALLCASAQDAFALSREVPPFARLLAERFWPGPLTLVLDSLKGGTVGVRVPVHPVACAVLAAYGNPLRATSANSSGKPAPHALEDIDATVRSAADFAIYGGPGSGEASAVVDLSGGKIQLLRPTESFGETELFRLANPA
ncbi:MAG: Sua5/YciO/YrdC/YwlC family protein [Rubrobacter sp.]|nr:Sua5/YciO/YrdC/YwlC family protein [Rubrobacter sp.]